MISTKYICLLLTIINFAYGQKDPHFLPGHTTIVHLFEWKWKDIADECERFLSVQGYGGVQISPPNENLVIEGRPWWERYQPVSYKIATRSGDEKDFLDMTTRCNAVGVRIYVDTVINHMSAGNGIGTGGSQANYDDEDFPGVPYTADDFHYPCNITDYNDERNVRYCQLNDLLDLDQEKLHVQQSIVNYMNHLIDLGVAGFRVDAAKHMWPEHLKIIYNNLKDLNTDFGFDKGARPFIYQEVIFHNGEAISKDEYTDFGTVIEFQTSEHLGPVFQGNPKLSSLSTWGSRDVWGLVDGLNAVAFIDNHDNQRGGGSAILTYKNPKPYKMAIGFLLAHPYGTTRIISSYDFDNFDQGPPADAEGNLISPGLNEHGTCTNGYVCEHRWRQIFNMVGFRNAVYGTGLNDWWSNGDQQIAFCRGDKGFVVFTNWGDIVDQDFQTCLSPGVYCDVVSGELKDGKCTGKTVTVREGGWGKINLGAVEEDGFLAIHANAKLQ